MGPGVGVGQHRALAWAHLQQVLAALAGYVSCFFRFLLLLQVPIQEPHPTGKRSGRAAGRGGEGAATGGNEVAGPEVPPVPEAEEDFLRRNSESYGYGGRIGEIRKEFPNLQGKAYLDHAGCTLYSDAQMRDVMADLTSQVYCNPHTGNATCDMEGARRQVLRYLNAPGDEYLCVFTSGATAALKLVGESFPWGEGSKFWYTEQNHNSVLGIREEALARGAAAAAVAVSPSTSSSSASSAWDVRPVGAEMRRVGTGVVGGSAAEEGVHGLLAMPAECNFSGGRFDPALLSQARAGAGLPELPRKGRWLTLLDAAKACTTSPPDLAAHPADFVALSFYKIFGYPTGLGALVMRKDAAAVLKKRYYGGGTVLVSVAGEDVVHRREGAQGMEDGTPSFLAIAALRHGFGRIDRLGGAPRAAAHAGALAAHLAASLASLRHPGGGRACVVYGAHASVPAGERPAWAVGQGPVVTFNLYRPDGSPVGYKEVEQVASLCGVTVRTGCFCNPGACSRFLGLSARDVIENFEAGHVCWDDHDVVNGRPTGAVRASLGYMSTYEDCERLLECVRQYFVSGGGGEGSASQRPGGVAASSGQGVEVEAEGGGGVLRVAAVTVYPIKSCSGYRPEVSWPLGPNGLLYDREWVLVAPDGAALTQKRLPALASLITEIDLAAGEMRVTAPGVPAPLIVPLDRPPPASEAESEGYTVRVCGDSVCADVARGDEGARAGGGVGPPSSSDWFARALGSPCRLVRQRDGSRLTADRGAGAGGRGTDGDGSDAKGEGEGGGERGALGFANEGQFLVVTEASVGDLNARMAARHAAGEGGAAHSGGPALTVAPQHFRPNLVLSGPVPPYSEDLWSSIGIGGGGGGEGGVELASLGGCKRCIMVNVDQERAKVGGSEPLLTLASYRRKEGRIMFGALMRRAGAGDGVVRVGAVVKVRAAAE